jgi:L-alanine-DL-glutamate epimerase-like enolase superfamily enzyme
MEIDKVQRKRVYASYAWTIVALFCLLPVPVESSPVSGKAPVNAIELLTAFSGERAKQYEPFFRFSEEARIVSVEIRAVGTESTTARYSGQEKAWKVVNNILRITTADGFEGISGVDSYHQGAFSDEQLLELQGIAANLLALKSLDPVEIGTMLERTRPDLSDASRSSIDIALWDLAARKADRPLYQLLGAKRDSIESYASLPFYESLAEYVEAVNAYAKLGYTTFKFHVWGLIEEDLRLVALIQQTFADSPYRFMIDLEGAYGFEDALRLGGKLDERLFVWLEAPIDDELLEQYVELRSRLGVSIIPAGYKIYSSEFIRKGIETDSWDAGRFDATTIAGISKALELLMIANDAGLSIEIQSWGHSLTQAANLHLMLANERTRYFEAPMPREAYEFGMKNGNLHERGRVVAPEKPGLGIEVDWDRLPTADFYIYSK